MSIRGDLAGKSGIELATDIVAETTGKDLSEKPMDRFGCSTEFLIAKVTNVHYMVIVNDK